MTVFSNIIDQLIDMAEVTKPYSQIVIGSTPPLNGLCMIQSANYPDITDLEKGIVVSLNVMLNGKHANQRIVYDTLISIHDELTRRKDYPNNNDYQIVNIATVSYPQLIDREDNKQYIYGSTLQVYFYWKKRKEL